MDVVKVMSVIFCEKKRRGKGVELDPIRIVTEIFNFDGILIAERDPYIVYTKQDMAEFALFVAKEEWLTVDILELLRRWKLNK